MSLVARLFDTLSLDAWKSPFSSIFGTAAGADAWLASDTTAFAETYIDSRETAEAYVFSARLPAGVTKEEVKVEVEEEGHVLVIAGQRSVRREARRDLETRRHVIERSSASFFGRFCLHEDAAVGQVRAAMDDGGELTVTVPRVGAALPVLPEPAIATCSPPLYILTWLIPPRRKAEDSHLVNQNGGARDKLNVILHGIATHIKIIISAAIKDY